MLPLGAGLAIMVGVQSGQRDPSDPATLGTRIAAGVVISALTIAVIALLLRRERRGLADAGLTGIRSGWRLALWGALVWAVPAALAFAVLAALGAPLSISSDAADVVLTVVLLVLAVLLLEALPEELVFRGYVTTALGDLTRGWATIVVQAVLFTLFAGVLRQNWNATDLSLFLAMGIGFGYIRMVTGSIWMSIGFHLAFQTGSQLVLAHDAVAFSGDTGAAMIALGVVPFTVAAVVVSSTGIPRFVQRPHRSVA